MIISATRLIEYKAAHSIFLNETTLRQATASHKLPRIDELRNFFEPRELATLNEAYNKFRYVESFLFEAGSSRSVNWRQFLALEDARIEEAFWDKAKEKLGAAVGAAKSAAGKGIGAVKGAVGKAAEKAASFGSVYDPNKLLDAGFTEDEIVDMMRKGLVKPGYLQQLGQQLTHAYSKLGRAQVGGKFVKGRKEFLKGAEAQMQQVLDDPKDQDKLVKDVAELVKKEYPGFPNNKNNFEFYAALQKIWGVYKTITAPENADKMSDEDKNRIIGNLRVYVKDLGDRQLSDAYIQAGAFERKPGKDEVKAEGIDSVNLLEADGVEGEKKDTGPYSRDVSKFETTKGMESKFLPNVLKTLGAVLGFAGGMLQTGFGKQWISDHFSELVKVEDPGEPPQELLQSFTDKVVKVDMAGEGKGKGVQYMIQKYLGVADSDAMKITKDTPVPEIMKHLQETTGAKTPDELFNKFADATYPGVKQSAKSAEELRGWFEDMSKFKGSWGDFYGKHPFVLIFAKTLFIPVVKTVAKTVGGRAASSMLLKAGANAAGLTLGAIAAPLTKAGLAITAAGVGMQWMRDKSSRLKMLQALQDQMVDVGQVATSSEGGERTSLEPSPAPAPVPPEESEGGGGGSGGGREGLFPTDDSGMIKLSDIKNFIRLKKLSPNLVDAAARALDAKGLLKNVNLNEAAIKPRAQDVDAAIRAIAEDDSVRSILAQRLGKEPEELGLDDIIDDKPLRQVVAVLVAGGVVQPAAANESPARSGEVLAERWQRLAGIVL